MRLKDVDLMDILCVSFASIRFMEIMSCTCICPLSTILAIYAKGNLFQVFEGNYLL